MKILLKLYTIALRDVSFCAMQNTAVIWFQYHNYVQCILEKYWYGYFGQISKLVPEITCLNDSLQLFG